MAHHFAKIRSLTAGALLDKAFKPRETILGPWLRQEETAVIWAASGVGKTMLSISIALVVAGGGNLADWNAPKARKVLYFDGEMHLQDIRDRVEMLLERESVCVADRELALGNLTFIARQGQDIGTSFFDLTSEESQEAILRLAQRSGAELVILDNFTTLSDGLDDENAATAFKQVQDFFLKMKRAGIATILIHHANKGGRNMRGSTALETTFEVILGLARPAIAAPGQARFVTEFTKFRGEGDERLSARTWTLEEDGWSVSESYPDDPREDPILLALRSLNFISLSEIGRELKHDKSTVSRRVKRLVALKVLKEGEANDLLGKAKELREADGKYVAAMYDLAEDHDEEDSALLAGTF